MTDLSRSERSPNCHMKWTQADTPRHGCRSLATDPTLTTALERAHSDNKRCIARDTQETPQAGFLWEDCSSTFRTLPNSCAGCALETTFVRNMPIDVDGRPSAAFGSLTPWLVSAPPRP